MDLAGTSLLASKKLAIATTNESESSVGAESSPSPNAQAVAAADVAMEVPSSTSSPSSPSAPSPPASPRPPPPPARPRSSNESSTSAKSSPPLEPILEHVKANHVPLAHRTRVDSVSSSISFKLHAGPARPAAGSQRTSAKATRTTREGRSPPPLPRFQHHVSFDNFAGGEPTAKNSMSFTLNVKHTGYQRKRRSRTFMVGVDENDYSDTALSWMLEELVDDGDEIICLRVVDKDAKVVSDRNVDRKTYQEEAKKLMERIQGRNDEHRAISIVLEYAVGKVHSVFQKMIQLYEPAMLVVGTRGRSLGGFQGLMNMSNSFSKWCLQYSPIPVVVVRPTKKRFKKKKKRDADPSRQDYARILKESGLELHETEMGATHIDFEISNAPDVEAHAVATALGLPAQFDPTLKPYPLEGTHSTRRARKDSITSDVTNASPDSRPSSPSMAAKRPKARRASTASRDSISLSGDESSDDEDGEFEAVNGLDLLDNGERKMKLHEMEVGEAAALAAGRKASVDSEGSLPLEGERSSADADEGEGGAARARPAAGELPEGPEEEEAEGEGEDEEEEEEEEEDDETGSDTMVEVEETPEEKEAVQKADTAWELGVQAVLMTLW